MTTGIQNIQLSSDRDYLEYLLFKLVVMKFHGANYYARKQEVDKKLFDAARKEVNDFMAMLKRRGYSGERFNLPKPIQTKLL